ncbi:hypothetical protein DFH27DRAFT_233219 [Peziza echinospora]|nr:hypothetical protein DFH27DRAFT_233219 [Peziza echinospora]
MFGGGTSCLPFASFFPFFAHVASYWACMSLNVSCAKKVTETSQSSPQCYPLRQRYPLLWAKIKTLTPESARCAPPRHRGPFVPSVLYRTSRRASQATSRSAGQRPAYCGGEGGQGALAPAGTRNQRCCCGQGGIPAECILEVSPPWPGARLACLGVRMAPPSW